MPRAIFLIILFYFFVVFQASFLPHFGILGNIPNLMLISLLIFIFLEKPKDNFSYFAAFAAGLFIDIFSNNFLGATVIFLLIMTFILKFGLSLLNRLTFLWFLFFSVAALLSYGLFLGPAIYLLHPLSFERIVRARSMVFLNPNLIFWIIYNLSITLFLYLALKILKNARTILPKNN